MKESLVTRDASPSRRLSRPLFWLVLGVFGVLAVFTGLRDGSVGTDTEVYSAIYTQIRDCNCFVDGVEPLFALLALVVGYFESSPAIFFISVSLIQFGLAYLLSVALRALSFKDGGGKSFQLLFFSLVLASPFFLNAQVNLLRQGIGAPLVLLSAVYFFRRRFWLSLLSAVIAIGFHYSSVLFLVLFPLLRLERKWLYALVGLLAGAYILGATESLVGAASELVGFPIYSFFQDYGADADYGRGVRYDFLAISVLPLVMLQVINLVFKSWLFVDRVDGAERIYLLLLVPFLLLGWGAFSDRYLLNAWLFAPALIALMLARFVPGRGALLAVTLVFVAVVVYGYFLAGG